jgi:endonuclease/exonuclease/phosphatase family metal-dependent hydrolase
MAGGACATYPSATLRVATLNIAHGRGLASSQVWLKRSVFEANLDAIAGSLNREAPDIVALQEVDAPSAWSGRFDHLARLADASGYPYRHHGLHFDAAVLKGRVKYGTALLSRRPIASTSSLDFDAKVVGSKGLVTAEIEFGGRSLLVASVHLNWYSTRIRLRQAGQVVKLLERIDLPILLMGDFNCHWNDDDALRMIANQFNLQPYTPDANKLDTFPAQAPDTRIDWILTSPELEFVTYRVHPDRVSDHLAVIADIRWVRPQARSRH